MIIFRRPPAARKRRDPRLTVLLAGSAVIGVVLGFHFPAMSRSLALTLVAVIVLLLLRPWKQPVATASLLVWVVALVLPVMFKSRGPAAEGAVVATAAGAAYWLISSISPSRYPSRRLALAILAVFTSVTLASSIYFRLSLHQALFGVSVAVGLSGALQAGARQSDEALRFLLRSLTIFAVAMTAMAIIEGMLERPLLDYSRFQRLLYGGPFRSSALLGHPLVLGTFLATIATSRLALLLLRERFTRTWTARHEAGLIGLLLFGAATTLSRSLAFLLFGSIIFLAVALRKHAGVLRSTSILLSTSVLAVTLAWAVVGTAFSDRISSLSTASQAGRLRAWSYTRAATSPITAVIGNGPGAVVSDILSHRTRYVHGLTALDNQYLTLLVEFGIPGLTVVLLVFILVARDGLLIAPRRLPWAAMAVALSIAGGFFEPLYWPPLLLLYGLSLGAVAGGRSPVPRFPRNTPLLISKS